MIDAIRQDAELSGLIRLCCEENGVGAELHQNLLGPDGFPAEDKVIILKIDEYYNGQNIANRPRSIDFLVLVKCCDMDDYALYLIELKNTRDKTQLRPSGILEKFKTTVDDFIQNKFIDVFSGGSYKRVKMYLVSQRKHGQEDSGKNRSSMFDAFASARPFSLLGMKVIIEPKLPNPVIEPC